MHGRKIGRTIWLAAFLIATAAPAVASTSAAWNASAKAGRAACIRATNLRRATVSAPITFSDQIGRDAVLVRGIYPQKFMRGAKGTMLCLYDRRTHRAEAMEARGWAAP